MGDGKGHQAPLGASAHEPSARVPGRWGRKPALRVEYSVCLPSQSLSLSEMIADSS